jgi:hypothetical protein
VAVTQAGTTLTEQHRRRQLGVRSLAARDTVRLMSVFDLADIDASFLAIAPGLEAVALDYHRQSAGVAAGYYQGFRSVEGAAGTAASRLAQPPARSELRYALGFSGVVVPKNLIGNGRLDVTERMLVSMVGTVTRQALMGGRNTILDTMREDRAALGYARVGAATPCAFCLLLISRGPVYEKATASFEAHVHCACTAEAVFTRDRAAWTDQAREASDRYNEVTRGSDDPLNAFRRAVYAGS